MQMESPTTEKKNQGWWSRIIDAVFAWLFSLLTVAMVAVVFLQVLNRYVFNNPLSWTEEVSRIIFIYMTFLGAYWALRQGSHIGVPTFMERFSRETRKATQTTVEFFLLFYLAYLFKSSMEFALDSRDILTPALNIPFFYVYLVMALAVGMMALQIISRLFTVGIKKTILPAIVALAVLGGIFAVAGGGKLSSGNLLVMTVVFLTILIVVHTPIAFAVGLASMLFLALQDKIPLEIVPHRMVGGVDHFPLLAIPYFILAGELMNTGGITQRLVDMAKVIVGHIRGGLGMTVVVGEYFFSGISGSTVADVSAIGSILIPAMKKAGYTPENSVAVVSAASAMGILVPPCISMVVLGGMTGISIAALFMAGFVPAVVMAICIMALIYYQAVKNNMPLEPKPTLETAMKAIGHGILPLLLPVIIFGGILSGAATATEVSVIAVIYGFVVGVFVYREIRWDQLAPIMVRTVTMTGTVMFLIAAASVLSWIFATNQVPKKIGEMIMYVSTSPWVFLLLSNIVFILLGAALEGLPALIILIPIFMPLLPQFSINPLHFGILTIAALGIGTFLPPVGMGIFIACNFAGIDIGRASRSFMPYLAVLFIGIMIISYVPWFTLILPELFFQAK